MRLGGRVEFLSCRGDWLHATVEELLTHGSNRIRLKVGDGVFIIRSISKVRLCGCPQECYNLECNRRPSLPEM